MTSPRTRYVPRVQVELVARVLHVGQAAQQLALVDALAAHQVQHHAEVRLGIAEAVDRRHRRDDDRVAALEQRLGRRQPHLLDVLVDRGVLLDVGVATTARRPRAGSSRSSETKYSTALCGKNSLNSP